MRRLLPIFLIPFSLLASPHIAHAGDSHLKVTGTELLLELADGRILGGQDLVGVQLVIGSPQGDKVVQIDAIEEGHVTTGGALQLYTLTYRNAERQIISNLCRPDATGRRAGFPLPDERGGFAFTCTSGAEGKCVLMGYRPWEIRDDVPMRDLHRACVRMVRADYGGDGVSTTRDGTLIDVFDRFGIQTPDRSVNMEFEAAWSPHGAVCVAHSRIRQNITLNEIAARYPRLANAIGTQACSEESARRDSRALIFNRSNAVAPEVAEKDPAGSPD